jgi:NAD-dependent SIR2 family protein deacetylase
VRGNVPLAVKCPRCNESYTGYPALSRRDNATDICSKCGTFEAILDITPFGEIPIEHLIVESRFHEKIGASYKVWMEWKNEPQSEVGYSARGIQ